MTATVPVRFTADVYGEALVDEADLPLVSDRRWSFTSGYVVGKGEYLHRVLFGLVPGDGQKVDHKNGDTLDNRRRNLRLCTQGENAQNRHRGPVGESHFRGVSRSTNGKRWVARVVTNGKGHHIGTFEYEMDAARAAARFRAEHMPFSVEDPALLAEPTEKAA
jgi:hypothetical protein